MIRGSLFDFILKWRGMVAASKLFCLLSNPIQFYFFRQNLKPQISIFIRLCTACVYLIFCFWITNFFHSIFSHLSSLTFSIFIINKINLRMNSASPRPISALSDALKYLSTGSFAKSLDMAPESCAKTIHCPKPRPFQTLFQACEVCEEVHSVLADRLTCLASNDAQTNLSSRPRSASSRVVQSRVNFFDSLSERKSAEPAEALTHHISRDVYSNVDEPIGNVNGQDIALGSMGNHVNASVQYSSLVTASREVTGPANSHVQRRDHMTAERELYFQNHTRVQRASSTQSTMTVISGWGSPPSSIESFPRLQSHKTSEQSNKTVISAWGSLPSSIESLPRLTSHNTSNQSNMTVVSAWGSLPSSTESFPRLQSHNTSEQRSVTSYRARTRTSSTVEFEWTHIQHSFVKFIEGSVHSSSEQAPGDQSPFEPEEAQDLVDLELYERNLHARVTDWLSATAFEETPELWSEASQPAQKPNAGLKPRPKPRSAPEARRRRKRTVSATQTLLFDHLSFTPSRPAPAPPAAQVGLTFTHFQCKDRRQFRSASGKVLVSAFSDSSSCRSSRVSTAMSVSSSSFHREERVLTLTSETSTVAMDRLVDDLSSFLAAEIEEGRRLDDILTGWEGLTGEIDQKTGLGEEWQAILGSLRDEIVEEMEEGLLGGK